MIDIAEGGLFIETTHQLRPGRPVTILPEGPHGAQLPFELRGQVVRNRVFDVQADCEQTPGIAFKLVGLAIEDRMQLRSFLRVYGTVLLTRRKTASLN